MFGSVSEWFYKSLAGIQPAPDAIGCDRLIIQPRPVGDLTWVKASYDSVRGKVVSAWEKNGNQFTLHVTIPVGASATLFMPAANPDSVREGDQRAQDAVGVRLLRNEPGAAVFAIASGSYVFTSHL